MHNNDDRVRWGCYINNLAMAATTTISPLLFLNFRQQYGVSYTQLGALVLANFITQLLVDLAFSFFSHRFNIQKAIRLMPILTLVGFLVYALAPVLLPGAVYIGLLAGTLIFAFSSGLSEVLISPIVAALPSEDPQKALSKLHAVYAWGVVGVAVVSTAFLQLAGRNNWPWLIGLFMLLPLMAAICFFTSKLPAMQTQDKSSGVLAYLKQPWLWVCVMGIFFGSAAEGSMGQWCSSYLERSLSIPKLWGDLFGVALFAVMLGLGRTLYTRYGKHINRVLLAGACGALVCFVGAAVGNAWVGLVACGLSGFCVSMLWPGSLIATTQLYPQGGVFIYALLAAGGDCGAAIGAQALGLVADAVIASPQAAVWAASRGLTAEQLGMKLGMLVGTLAPLLAAVAFVLLCVHKRKMAAAE